jgi:hypothetical protein
MLIKCYYLWASWMQYIPLHPIYLRAILILSTRFRRGISSNFFPSD